MLCHVPILLQMQCCFYDFLHHGVWQLIMFRSSAIFLGYCGNKTLTLGLLTKTEIIVRSTRHFYILFVLIHYLWPQKSVVFLSWCIYENSFIKRCLLSTYSLGQTTGPNHFACIFQMLWPNLLIFGTYKRQVMTNSAMEKLNNDIMRAHLKWIQKTCFCSRMARRLTAKHHQIPAEWKSPLLSLPCGQHLVDYEV